MLKETIKKKEKSLMNADVEVLDAIVQERKKSRSPTLWDYLPDGI